MDFKEYQHEMMRTASEIKQNHECLSLGALGIAGEAGEVADYIKKVIFHQHELSTDKLAHELGDVLWYVTYLSAAIGYELEEIASLNVDKLKQRYPEGWDPARSQNR